MSVHRSYSVRDTNYTGGSRPFSTNNPFRNASYDSNIGHNSRTVSGNSEQQQHFNQWVQRNQSQMSFSSDDEDSELFKPPPNIRPVYSRSNSQGSTHSNGSARGIMPPPRMPRRSSNNPFSDSLSPSSTGGSNEYSNTPPTYPSDSTNNNYYSSSNEKARQRQHEQQQQPSSNGDLPPSYEEAAGPKVFKSSYPREKSGSSSSSSRPHRSQSDSDRHRTRVNREWPGDGTNQQSSSGSRPHRSTSGRTREHGSREHRSDRDRERSHRSRSTREGGSGTGESKSSRHRSSSEKHGDSKSKSKSKPKPKNVDTIDKLDVTGLFGGTFHHDGPFDACTPQRNKNQKSAPVLAFPADGPNNSIKGKAPENIKDSTIDYVMGRTTEFGDDDLYTASVSPRKQQPPLLANQYNSAVNQSQSTIAAVKNTENITSFDTNKKATPVHGETTLGLGSSTFLDGAPASKDDAANGSSSNGNGLGRKKSIKNKLRNPSPQFDVDEDEPIRFSPDKSETSGGNSLLKRVRSLKVGRNKS